MWLTIDRSCEVMCLILVPRCCVTEKESSEWEGIERRRLRCSSVVKDWNHLLLAASEMPKQAKGKGPRAAKVTKAPAWVTRSTSGNTPQGSGRSEGEGSPSSSAIGREEVALVVEEVLKTLKQRDIAPSGSNRNDSTPHEGWPANLKPHLQGHQT